MMIDLDELPVLHNHLRGFSWNAWNVLSVYSKDFGVDASQGLREGVDDALAASGITEKPAQVFLSCYPRILGFAFNPISLYYCLNADSEVFAVIHEVHNTFGERHTYALPVQKNEQNEGCDFNEQASNTWIKQTTDKTLFVSPFAHMDMHYHFRLNVPNERQILAIRLHDDEGLVLTASYSATRRPLTSRTLLGQAAAMPLLFFKVVLGIHWEAFLLWIKRVPWFRHVPKDTAHASLTKSRKI